MRAYLKTSREFHQKQGIERGDGWIYFCGAQPYNSLRF